MVAVSESPRSRRPRAAHAAHAAWLLRPGNAGWAWSDQMLAGEVMASRYYPRGVTAALWLDEADRRWRSTTPAGGHRPRPAEDQTITPGHVTTAGNQKGAA